MAVYKPIDAFTGEPFAPNFTGFRFSRPREEPAPVMGPWDSLPPECKDADGWIEHVGNECPVPPETRVEVRLRGGGIHSSGLLAGEWGVCWSTEYTVTDQDIVAYRVLGRL